MPWFKTDDSFYSHPKVVSIPRAIRPSALGTWLLAGTWSADHLTDGVIPVHQVEELGGSMEGAHALVKAKLWTKTRTEFRFKSWDEYQPTRAQVEDARETERTRKAEYRSRAKGHQQESASRPTRSPAPVPVGHQWDTTGRPDTPTRPDPTRPDLPSPTSKEGGAQGALPPVDNSEPATRCPEHLASLQPPRCGACKDARKAHEAWEQSQAAARPARPSAWRPGLCRDHLQLEDSCEMCARENAHAAEVIHGHFGATA